MLCPMDDYEQPLLYLPGTGIASQEIAISGSCQQNLAGIHIGFGFGGCLWDGSPGGAVSRWSCLQSLLQYFDFFLSNLYPLDLL